VHTCRRDVHGIVFISLLFLDGKSMPDVDGILMPDVDGRLIHDVGILMPDADGRFILSAVHGTFILPLAYDTLRLLGDVVGVV